MEEQKATIDNKELEKKWEDQIVIRKVISKHGREDNKNSKSVGHNSVRSIEVCSREKKLDGLTVQITIEGYVHVLLIWGIVKESNVCMTMVVERDKIQ